MKIWANKSSSFIQTSPLTFITTYHPYSMAKLDFRPLSPFSPPTLTHCDRKNITDIISFRLGAIPPSLPFPILAKKTYSKIEIDALLLSFILFLPFTFLIFSFFFISSSSSFHFLLLSFRLLLSYNFSLLSLLINFIFPLSFHLLQFFTF